MNHVRLSGLSTATVEQVMQALEDDYTEIPLQSMLEKYVVPDGHASIRHRMKSAIARAYRQGAEDGYVLGAADASSQVTIQVQSQDDAHALAEAQEK